MVTTLTMLLLLYLNGMLVTLVLIPHYMISRGFVGGYEPTDVEGSSLAGFALASIVLSLFWPLTNLYVWYFLKADIEKGNELLIEVAKKIKERDNE